MFLTRPSFRSAGVFLNLLLSSCFSNSLTFPRTFLCLYLLSVVQFSMISVPPHATALLLYHPRTALSTLFFVFFKLFSLLALFTNLAACANPSLWAFLTMVAKNTPRKRPKAAKEANAAEEAEAAEAAEAPAHPTITHSTGSVQLTSRLSSTPLCSLSFPHTSARRKSSEYDAVRSARTYFVIFLDLAIMMVYN